MSKELEYEINNFANLLHKDCMNLMEALKKQDKDNKAILYVGRHFKKVILPYEEYQKMCNRLESIDNTEPSVALECLEKIDNTLCLNNIKGKLEFGIDTEEHTDCDSVIGMTEDLETIKQVLLHAEQEKVLEEVSNYIVGIKALKNNCIFTRFGKKECLSLERSLRGDKVELYLKSKNSPCIWYLSDYQKTWWLKEDKSE